MLFNTYTNGDPRSFFYYKGDYYINGTEIILTDEYIKNHQFNGKKLWKYARYHHQTNYNGKVSYFFCRNKSDWLSLHEMGLGPNAADDYAPYFVIEAYALASAIQTITKPIKLERSETEAVLNAIVEPKKDWDDPGLLRLWLIYIVVMAGSLIFNQFYIIWAVVTYLFMKIRKDMLNQ